MPVLSCIDEIDGPFAVINADDYYGVHAFKMAYDFLTSEQEKEDVYHYMMVGYRLENTLTENGHVARGVCVTDEEGHLIKINERTHIENMMEVRHIQKTMGNLGQCFRKAVCFHEYVGIFEQHP